VDVERDEAVVVANAAAIADDDEDALIAIVNADRDEAVIFVAILVGDGDDAGCRHL